MKQLKQLFCKLEIHNFKPFKRVGSVNWHIITIKGKRCNNCRKEIIE